LEKLSLDIEKLKTSYINQNIKNLEGTNISDSLLLSSSLFST
jgi:hypothetical protein